MSTTGAKPVGFTDYIWAKCKSQPLIPFGKSHISSGSHAQDGHKYHETFEERDKPDGVSWSDADCISGIGATCFALGGATWNLRTGNRQRFNHYLRLRVM